MKEYLGTLGDVATAAAAVITVLSLIALLVKGITYLGTLPNRIRMYFFYKPRYILIPTPDELAKYCEKSFDSHKITIREEYEEVLYSYNLRNRKFTSVAKSRVQKIYYFSAVVFCIFEGRLIYYGLSSNPESVGVGPNVILSLLTSIIMFLFVLRLTIERPAGEVSLLKSGRLRAMARRYF